MSLTNGQIQRLNSFNNWINKLGFSSPSNIVEKNKIIGYIYFKKQLRVYVYFNTNYWYVVVKKKHPNMEYYVTSNRIDINHTQTITQSITNLEKYKI